MENMHIAFSPPDITEEEIAAGSQQDQRRSFLKNSWQNI